MNNLRLRNNLNTDFYDQEQDYSDGSQGSEDDVNTPQFNRFLDHEVGRNQETINHDEYMDEEEFQFGTSEESDYSGQSDLDSLVSDTGHHEDVETDDNAFPEHVHGEAGESSAEDMDADSVNGENVNLNPLANQLDGVDSETESDNEDPFGDEGNDQIVEQEHTHPPDNADVEVARAKARLLNLSENSEMRTSVIVSRSLMGLSLVAHGRLPDDSTLSRTVRRKRAGQVERPINPTSVEHIPLPFPDAYSVGTQGEPWLRWDSQDENRTLMFASGPALDVLSNSAHWFVDGTFSVTPLAYHQLYTIHALVGTVNIPCVYVLMRRRRQADYERMFARLKRLRRLRPSDILLDFEVAAINALRNQFPAANLKGCYFHLAQSVWRYIQQTRFAKWAYQNIPDFAVTCRMIPAIAFLPPARIKRALLFVTAYAIHRHHHVLLRDTLRYFAVVYTGTNLTPPTYPQEFWSVADRVCDGLPKSNNAVEGWHSGLSTHIGCAHPPLWTFLEGLREQNEKQHMRMVHAIQDRRMETNRGSMWVRTQIARMYNRYRDHFEDLDTPLHGPTVVTFLKAVAYLYRMV